MKKILSVLILMAVLMTAAPLALAEDITLTWAVFETNNYTAEFYQTIIDAFEKDNPGIRIEKVLMTGDSRPQFLKTMLSAGNMPDINIDPVDLANIEGVYAEVPDSLLDQFDPSAVVTNNGVKTLIPPTPPCARRCSTTRRSLPRRASKAFPPRWRSSPPPAKSWRPRALRR